MGRPQKERTAFGARLQEARTGAGLSQPQLEKLTGVGQSTIAEAEWTGDSLRKVAEVAKACGVRVEWLATGEEPKYPATPPSGASRLFRDLDAIESVILTKIRAVFTESELPAVLQSLDAYAALHPVGSNPVPTGLRFEFHRIPAAASEGGPVVAAEARENKRWNQATTGFDAPESPPTPPNRRVRP